VLQSPTPLPHNVTTNRTAQLIQLQEAKNSGHNLKLLTIMLTVLSVLIIFFVFRMLQRGRFDQPIHYIDEAAKKQGVYK
jgi:preprotein translocase subunit SecY